MNRTIFFTKITPVYILCVAGILYGLFTLLPLFTKAKGNAGDIAIGYPFVLIGIFLLLLILCVDRLLADRLALRPLFIAESCLIILLTFMGLYAFKKTTITIYSQRAYFFIQYDDAGLQEKDFERKVLFSRKKTFENDSIIHLHSQLAFDKDVVLAIKNPAWDNSYQSKGTDTIVNGRKIILYIYMDPLGKADTDSLLNKKMKEIALGK